jgi:hypothetical protein
MRVLALRVVKSIIMLLWNGIFEDFLHAGEFYAAYEIIVERVVLNVMVDLNERD